MRLQWGRNLSVAEGATCRPRTWHCGLLQWGRNLSVAEGRRRLVDGLLASQLQWGRNLSVAEGLRRASALHQPPPASMGPQPFGCGRPPTPGTSSPAKGFNGAATFRLRKARIVEFGMALGPCFNGAATFRLRKAGAAVLHAVVVGALQWGRNLSVAEGTRRPRRLPAGSRFNGAATFRLRKGRSDQRLRR